MANKPLPEQHATHTRAQARKMQSAASTSGVHAEPVIYEQETRRYNLAGYAPAINLPTQPRTTKRPRVETFEYEEPARTHTSTRRYTQPAATVTTQRVQVQVHRRTTSQQPVRTTTQPTQRAVIQVSRRAFVGIGTGMAIMSALCIGVPLVTNAINAPDPQATYQTDAVVGQHDDQSDPSHFLAFNLNHHIDVIEMQGGDPNQTKIYSTPAFIAQGTGPLHLTFRDVNGDHKADMIITESGSTFVFLNDGDGFRPARPGEVHSS